MKELQRLMDFGSAWVGVKIAWEILSMALVIIVLYLVFQLLGELREFGRVWIY